MATTIHRKAADGEVYELAYLVREARNWLLDCFGSELPADLSNVEVIDAVGKYYDGGWAAFTEDVA